MEHRRSYEYMGFNMTAGVDGDHEAGFFVSTQIIQSLTSSETGNVPVDGVAAGPIPHSGQRVRCRLRPHSRRYRQARARRVLSRTSATGRT
ncbi:hypothetical protein [Paraburkholderia mimosarum]|uniref:hypothetical protein n=1 Tax=Paraburkholderia mimosarum TaxID=312026 RepID=UPI0012DF4E2E|nr:hypothetical protein [Paraburkholderia mimosarum]